MKRSLIWTEGNEAGWSCSNCQWRFVLPPLLSGEKAMGTYDRLAAARFHEHSMRTCRDRFWQSQQNTTPDTFFVDRARMLIMRGYKPKMLSNYIAGSGD